MRDVVIVSAVRTAVGAFGGTLKGVKAVDLGAIVIEEAIKRAQIDKDIIDEVIMGNVLQAGLGQNPARQASIKAGVHESIPSFTINKVCGSGLRAISLGAQMIKAGDADAIVVGGMESMSQAPHVVPNARWGNKMGNVTMVDVMINDGLWDAFNDYHMGITAENIAEKWNLTREMQDEFAAESQKKAEQAIKDGRFKEEIVPVVIPNRKGDPTVFEVDEYPKSGTTFEKLSKLKPAFKKGGTVTAGNASGINDGAAALVIMSLEKAQDLGLKPIAKIVSYASKGLDPKIMGYGPVMATREALKKANLNIDNIDLIEANEAFAAQSLAVAKDLGFDMSKVNVNGGAIAIGHPIGASGARIAVTLIHEMLKRDDAKLGLATLCIGGGQGTSLIIEKL